MLAPRPDPKAARSGISPGGARLIVAAVAAGCATVVLCLPSAVAPRFPPEIWPDAAEAELDRAIERDAELAERAATLEGPAVGRLRRLYAEQGRAEVQPGESPNETYERYLGLSRLLAVVEESEPEAARWLRAAALTELWPALRGELEIDRERAVLGSFPRILERYGAARDGRRIAPRSVLRVLYAARWNVIHGRERTEGFNRAEAQAYWGWAVLNTPHEAGLEEVRREAMREYAELEGPGAEALAAYLAYRGGEYARAAGLYQRLFERHNLLRDRNHARAALLRASE